MITETGHMRVRKTLMASVLTSGVCSERPCIGRSSSLEPGSRTCRLAIDQIVYSRGNLSRCGDRRANSSASSQRSSP